MGAPFSQFPDQIAVHRPKEQLAPGRTRGCPLYMRQKPMQLCGGKRRIKQKAGLLRDFCLMSLGAQTIAKCRCAPILPNNRLMDWGTGVAVPYKGRFALIGNADGGDIFGRAARLRHHTANNRLHRGPNLLCIMFHPSRLREILWKFLLAGLDRAHVFIKKNGTARRRALVDRQNIGHENSRRLRTFRIQNVPRLQGGCKGNLTAKSSGHDEFL